jgi:hypothetical protein
VLPFLLTSMMQSYRDHSSQSPGWNAEIKNNCKGLPEGYDLSAGSSCRAYTDIDPSEVAGYSDDESLK